MCARRNGTFAWKKSYFYEIVNDLRLGKAAENGTYLHIVQTSRFRHISHGGELILTTCDAFQKTKPLTFPGKMILKLVRQSSSV